MIQFTVKWNKEKQQTLIIWGAKSGVFIFSTNFTHNIDILIILARKQLQADIQHQLPKNIFIRTE